MEEDANNKTEKKRQRISRACDLCRRKKVKCHFNPGEPCFNCIAYKETCLFSNESKKRGPSKETSHQLEKRLKKIEEQVSQTKIKKKLSERPIIAKSIKISTTTNNNNTDDDDDIQGQQHQLVADKSKIIQNKDLYHQHQFSASKYVQDIDSLRIRQWPPGIAYDSIYYLGDTAELQFLSGKIKLDDNSKWKGHRIKKFGDRIVLVDSSVDEKNISGNKIPHFQWKCVAPKLHDIHGYIYAVTGVDQYTSARLLKIYFANVHPILPVINKIEFLKQYRNQADTYPSAELLNAMFGAAARFVECEHLEPSHLKSIPADAIWELPMGWSNHFFDQAQDIISNWTANPTDSKIQAIILIQNHRGNLDSKSSACWLMGGFAIRLAQMIGLHKNCDTWDISESEKQTRKRVFWSLYVSDRFQSALSGKPLSIQDEDIDVSYPETSTTWNEILDNGDDFYGPRFPSAMSIPQIMTENGEIYQLLFQFIKLSEILGKIIQGIYSPLAQQRSYEYGSYDLVTSLDNELTEWRFSFSKTLRQSKYDDFNEDNGYFSPVIASMQLFYFSALILLHRPFIQLNGDGKHVSKSSYSSFQICSSAATRGIRIASGMSIRDFLLCPYSFSLYPLMQCCLIHIYNIDNPDIQISNAAKMDLEIGMDLLDRLRDMSSSAKKLNILLQNILDNKQHVYSNEDVNNNHNNNDNNNNITNNHKNNFTFMDLTSASGTKSILSEVKKGNIPISARGIACEFNNNNNISQNNILNLNSFNPISTSVPLSSTNINAHQQHVQEHQYNYNLLSENGNKNFQLQEAYTLRQFGLSSTSNNNTNNQNKSNLSFNSPTLNENNTNENTSSNEILFRNDPKNTFFGIPLSMNWGEWDGWLERTMTSDSNWQSLDS